MVKICKSTVHFKTLSWIFFRAGSRISPRRGALIPSRGRLSNILIIFSKKPYEIKESLVRMERGGMRRERPPPPKPSLLFCTETDMIKFHRCRTSNVHWLSFWIESIDQLQEHTPGPVLDSILLVPTGARVKARSDRPSSKKYSLISVGYCLIFCCFLSFRFHSRLLLVWIGPYEDKTHSRGRHSSFYLWIF